MNSTQALRVLWLLTTLPQSELLSLRSPPSSDLSADLPDRDASLPRSKADSRGKRLVRRGRFVYYDDYEHEHGQNEYEYEQNEDEHEYEQYEHEREYEHEYEHEYEQHEYDCHCHGKRSVDAQASKFQETPAE